MNTPRPSAVPPVTIEQMVAADVRLELTVVAGQAGLGRLITVPRIQKPGLALTGWNEQLHDARVLILGGTEIDYLQAIGDEAAAAAGPTRETGRHVRPSSADDGGRGGVARVGRAG